jgi:hypothetical protein
MRKPYPFKVPVDHDDPSVHVKVMVDMPVPQNLTVHLANEHAFGPGLGRDETARVIAHLTGHLYGYFREGADHYHVEGEQA